MGVPQGGTLAPILFILFMNDIVSSSKVFEFSIYADDTCLGISIVNGKYNDTIKFELKKVMDWFNDNQLLVNVSKTDYLFLVHTIIKLMKKVNMICLNYMP